jgi:flavin-dependent dehydrogenase
VASEANVREYDVIIVGAGPSDCATAIQLANRGHAVAPLVLLLDKAVFPRVKLCAGGLTADADLILRELGVHMDLPAIPVHLSQFVFPTGRLLFEQPDHLRVIFRDQFDALLFRAAQERGVVTQDGEEVEAIIRLPQEVIVTTSKEEYSTKILVGAPMDSAVRLAVGLLRNDRLMVAMESILPLGNGDLPEFTDNMALLDVGLTSKVFLDIAGSFQVYMKTLALLV